jgi:hypothetical protein
VVAAYEVAVPAQDGVGGDDQVQLPQRGPGESVQEGGEELRLPKISSTLVSA